ncbi:CGNR zinc finger domain-containing protein [Streptomyces sp. NPDC088354]|uniref:CGNR zinc finger domain-containing protein n=1 Tax=unclassified Streptomyces TaxID=2593676 RepID=UPI0029AC17BC|nr:CGNR zinc finger domain-containing protein [Streptomyces sp. MI02-7b]MDX3072823.1 CGNR zinc finger domain-containing protein [Streptomyces sp. MI02-7b]
MIEEVPATPRTRITAKARSLRFDAGSLSLDLVATVGRRPSTPIERLDGPERLRAWCAGVGLAPRDEEDPAALLAALRTLRDAAHDVVTAHLDDRAPRPESVSLLNTLARVAPPAPRLPTDADGRLAHGPAPSLTTAELLSAVARDLIAVMTDPRTRALLRTCDAEACRMIYLDNGPGSGKPRRWCSMERCGNSAKAARHRRRAARP